MGAARLAPGAEWGEGHLVRLCSNQFGLKRKIDEVLAAQCSSTILSGHLGSVQLWASSLYIGASQALAAQCSSTILSGPLGSVQLWASSLCIGASQARG